MGTVALVLLLVWLVMTAIMTFTSGRLASQHDTTGAMRRQDDMRRLTAPPSSAQDAPENGR